MHFFIDNRIDQVTDSCALLKVVRAMMNRTARRRVERV